MHSKTTPQHTHQQAKLRRGTPSAPTPQHPSPHVSAAEALAHDLKDAHIGQYTDDRDTSDGQLIST